MSTKKLKNAKLQSRLRRSKRLNHQLKQQDQVRLRIHRTSKHIYAQIIKGANILASASTRESEFSNTVTSNVASSQQVGLLVGQRAVSVGMSRVAFDRAGFKYHGRVKALADGARKAGLVF